MPDFRGNARGIVAMLLASLAFIANDAMVKIVSDDLGTGQIIFLRGVLALALIGGLAWWTGALARWRMALSPLMGLRTLGEVGATTFYLTALFHMPIANATAILQAVPLVLTACSAIFLAERVGWRRWSAVAIGFLGMLLIVRPGAEGFNAYALLALVGVACVTIRDLSTRGLPPAMPTLLITTVTTAAVMLMGGVMAGAGGEWAPVTSAHWMLLAGAAVLIVAGYSMIVVAMRNGEVSVVTPFRYSLVPWSILLGWLIWADVPDAVTMLGIAIIMATGIYTFYRERKAARERRVAPNLGSAERLPMR